MCSLRRLSDSILKPAGTAGAVLAIVSVVVVAAGTFTATGSMTTPRHSHTATRLDDGTVLVAGGTAGGVVRWASAEVYDPLTGTFAAVGSMDTPRFRPTATRLADGAVLVAGGIGVNSSLASAEVYDPTTETFTTVGSMTTQRGRHTATRLVDGTVLVAGGAGGSADIYNPVSGTFATAGSMTASRFSSHTATLLDDGTVLLAGGRDGVTTFASAEIYDPLTEMFTAVGSMTTARNSHTATRLADGTVLVTGGTNSTGHTASAEVYDPTTETFVAVGSMTTERVTHSATRLDDGKVLVPGGQGFTTGKSADVYNPASRTFAAAGSMTASRRGSHTVTLLDDGTVLVAGGSGAFASAELFDPIGDDTPPVLALPNLVIEEATSAAGAVVSYIASALDDVDGAVTPDCAPASGSTFPLGTTEVTCTATDNSDNTSTGYFDVTVQDTAPPAITSLTADPAVIWPPNGRMIPVTVAWTVDDVDPAATCAIESVASSEPVGGLGAHRSGPDWQIEDADTVLLRAERRGGGGAGGRGGTPRVGRIYTITVRCADSEGNAATGETTVHVPHDRRR